MRILTEKINLDLNQNGIQATIDLREGDIESRLIIATLRGYGDAFRPDDNVIAVIRAKKPDGTIIYNNCLVEDGKVKFLVTSQYAAVEGNYNACIELIKDGVVLYSPKFSFHVAANELSDSEVESSSEYTELTTALEQALTALELAENLHLIQYVDDLEVPGDSKYLYVLEDSAPYFTMTDFPTAVSSGTMFESTDETYPLLLFTGMILQEDKYEDTGVVQFRSFVNPSATGEQTSMFGYDVANEKWVKLQDFDYYGDDALNTGDELILTDEAAGDVHNPVVTDYVIKSNPKYEVEPTRNTRVVYIYDNEEHQTIYYYILTSTGNISFTEDSNVIDLDNIPDVLVGNTSIPYVYDELLNKYIPLCDTDDLKQRVAALESEMSDAEGDILNLGRKVDALEAADVVINGEIDAIQDELRFNITITHDLYSGFNPFINQSFDDIEDALGQYKNIPIVLIYSYGDSSYKYASGCMYMHSMTHSVKFRFDIGTEDQAHYLTYTLTSDDTLTYSEELLDIKTHVKRLGIVLANNVATSNIAGLDLWNMVGTSETVTLDITYTDGSNNTSYHKSCVATMKHKVIDTEIEASAIFVKNNKLYARYIDILIGAVTGNYEGSYAVTDVNIPWYSVGYGDGLVEENMYLKVKPKTNGGILVDSNGVFVDTTKIQTKLGNTSSAAITPDNKVTVVNPICPVYKHESGSSTCTCNMTYNEVIALYNHSASLLNNVAMPQLINIYNEIRSTAVAIKLASGSIVFRFEIKSVEQPDAIQSFVVRHNSNDTIEFLSNHTNSGKRSYQHLLTTPNNTIEISHVDKEKDSIKIADDVMNKINNSVMIGTASGSVASIDDGGNDMPLKSCIVAIEPVQSGSGDPSPSNVRPITGWTECNVNLGNANLFGGEKFADYIVANVPNATKNTINKTVTYEARYINHIPIFSNFKENTQYTFKFLTSSTATNLLIVYTDNTKTTVLKNDITVSTAGKTIAYLEGDWSTGETVLNYEEVGIFEGVITADQFVPYNGKVYNIQFPSEAGTVYGGILDVTNGVLTVNRVMIDLGDLTYTYYVTNAYFKATVTGKAQGQTNIISSAYSIDTSSVGSMANGTMKGETSSSDVIFKNTSYTDANAFATAMEGVQLVYELATPQTYQLTPTEVKTLLGINNIFADCGDVDVEYVRDATSIINYILSKIENI